MIALKSALTIASSKSSLPPVLSIDRISAPADAHFSTDSITLLNSSPVRIFGGLVAPLTSATVTLSDERRPCFFWASSIIDLTCLVISAPHSGWVVIS